MNNKDSVDNRKKIKTGDKGEHKLDILFAIQKMTNEDIINKVGPYNLKNPVAEIINCHFSDTPVTIFTISSSNPE